jgi:SHS2 domain-containing protein
MKNEFEVVDHTADIGIIARGSDLGGLFAAAARGMTSLLMDTGGIGTDETVSISLHEADSETLLVQWLNRLLYELEVNRLAFREFDVTVTEETKLEAFCRGGTCKGMGCGLRREIKAATYHDLSIEHKNGIYSAKIIFDI